MNVRFTLVFVTATTHALRQNGAIISGRRRRYWNGPLRGVV